MYTTKQEVLDNLDNMFKGPHTKLNSYRKMLEYFDEDLVSMCKVRDMAESSGIPYKSLGAKVCMLRGKGVHIKVGRERPVQDKVREYLDENLELTMPIKEIAERIGISPHAVRNASDRLRRGRIRQQTVEQTVEAPKVTLSLIMKDTEENDYKDRLALAIMDMSIPAEYRLAFIKLLEEV